MPPLPLPALTTTFSAGAISLPKLSVRSSQLLCWELTGQHPISNKACHRAVASLRFTRASRRWRFPAHPRESPASSSRRNVFPIFVDALPPVTSFVYRSRTAFFPSRNPASPAAFIYRSESTCVYAYFIRTNCVKYNTYIFFIIIVWLVISIDVLRDYTFILVYSSVFVNMQFSILLPD